MSYLADFGVLTGVRVFIQNGGRVGV